VLASGDVDEGRARGIADAAVAKPVTGVYCIDVDGGAQNAMATVDTALNSAASILASTLLTSCPAGKEVEVHTFDEIGLPADLGFYVLVN
jgi:hypothetical protein